jgi:hypothetical protein
VLAPECAERIDLDPDRALDRPRVAVGERLVRERRARRSLGQEPGRSRGRDYEQQSGEAG